LGFADQSHLSRQFKQVYGVGPAAYRSARVER
jgi:AraC-like DNA-binding protein